MLTKDQLNSFIQDFVVERKTSLFLEDFRSPALELEERIMGKSFLIIGGAGTIGSNFIRTLLPFRPNHITVVDYDENGLTELVRDLRSSYGTFMPDEFITYAIDFGSDLMQKIMENHKYHVVACFAAHKHVRSEKDIIAVEAMVRNNFFNTSELLRLAASHQPEHVFAVSTDKASNPVNVMGGTKKLMENLLLSYSSVCHVTTARFANVAFSQGSLLDGFLYRIHHQQPLTAPRDIKRYFVTPEESGQICLLACLMGQSSEIFFPRLTIESMKTFSEIANHFLNRCGLIPDECLTEEEARYKAANRKPGDTLYPVFYFDSDTTGEKPYEEFYSEKETIDLATYKALGIIRHSHILPIQNIDQQIDAFSNLFSQKNVSKRDLIALMCEYLPEFEHNETGKNLDSKM